MKILTVIIINIMRLILFIIVIFPILCYSQTFEKIISDYPFQKTNDIIEVDDGFIIGGMRANSATENRYPFVIKTDKHGVEINRVEFDERCRDLLTLTKVGDSVVVLSYVIQNSDDSIGFIYRTFDFNLDSIQQRYITTQEKDSELLHGIQTKTSILPSGTIINTVGFFSNSSPAEINGFYLVKLNAELLNITASYQKRPEMRTWVRSSLSYPNSDTLLLFFGSRVYKINNNLLLVDSFLLVFYSPIDKSSLNN